MKITERIRNVYPADDVIIREKAVSLFVVSVSMFVGFALLAVVRLAGGHLAMGIGELIVSLIMGISGFMILKGFYRIVSIVALILFYSAASGLFAIRELVSPNDLYALPTYFIPVLLTAPLLAYTRWQVIGTIALALAGEIILYIVKVLPFVRSIGAADPGSEMAVAFLLSLFSGIFTYQLFEMQRRSHITMQSQTERSRRQYDSLSSIVDGASRAFDLGERLSGSARHNLETAERMLAELGAMKERMQALLADMATNERANGSIAVAKDAVRTVMESQARAIETAVASTGVHPGPRQRTSGRR